ncbi:DUF4412 domain-containing protein [Lutimonas halocynthiae]|uniref:DUF4412 domain-containing protein n=1 Tax=Lutimonas halocynthiae TaxID=1446477 RepID=UPI0025B3219A|nr:DUF4412 domain-containing protein [Lutimonas halocynthiae]MDN3641233.1 DUF4412 domain-containing protein [Lutimonas halocynthiae]
MRLYKLISLSLLISIISINNLEAQLLKKLKKRVQEATEEVVIEKVAEKSAQETGKAMDSLLNIDPEYQSDYQNQLNQMMLAGGESIPVEDSYAFDKKVMYKMEITGNDKPSIVNYEMWFSDNSEYMATRVQGNESPDSRDMPSSMLSILDEKNKAMIVIMKEQKMAQVLSMDKIKNIAIEENEKDSVQTDFNSIKKTGRTKKILGHTCDEFISTNESNTFSFWVTEDLELFQKNMFFNLSKSLGGNSFNTIPEEAKGFMMEMHYENSENNETTTMTVIDIQSIKNTINMNEYQLMNLGQFMTK